MFYKTHSGYYIQSVLEGGMKLIVVQGQRGKRPNPRIPFLGFISWEVSSVSVRVQSENRHNANISNWTHRVLGGRVIVEAEVT